MNKFKQVAQEINKINKETDKSKFGKLRIDIGKYFDNVKENKIKYDLNNKSIINYLWDSKNVPKADRTAYVENFSFAEISLIINSMKSVEEWKNETFKLQYEMVNSQVDVLLASGEKFDKATVETIAKSLTIMEKMSQKVSDKDNNIITIYSCLVPTASESLRKGNEIKIEQFLDEIRIAGRRTPDEI